MGVEIETGVDVSASLFPLTGEVRHIPARVLFLEERNHGYLQ